MDVIFILALAAVVVPILGTVVWWVGVFLVTRWAIRRVASSQSEFQSMPIDRQIATLRHLQAMGQLGTARQYMSSLDGPVTSEVRSMAAREGISLDF